MSDFQIEWVDGLCAPKGVGDPRYPDGIHLDITGGRSPSCQVGLPYPAPRCGFYVVACDSCGVRIVVTTAGRTDDPRSVRIACRRDDRDDRDGDTKLQ
jgi:hypothetical protein